MQRRKQADRKAREESRDTSNQIVKRPRRRAEMHKGGKIGKEAGDRAKGRATESQAGREASRQANRQVERQRSREVDR